MAIERYAGIDLSLSRAISIEPQFDKAYAWFIDNQNTIQPRPYGRHTPEEVGFPLAAQRGIHKPSCSKYAISITSASNDVYTSDRLLPLEDGTWQLIYCAHRQNSGKTMGSMEYNLSLRRCLYRGLPVGVFLKEGSAYRCCGLAFVESYDSSTDLFLLRGPVTWENDQAAFSPIPPGVRDDIRSAYLRDHRPHFTESELLAAAKNIDDSDETDRRRRVSEEVVRRQYQAKFRSQLINAYDGRCAISGYDAIPALQAAHISSYLGPQSQKPTNGLLLRADLHILFDASMLAVDPDTFQIKLSDSLSRSQYSSYHDCRIRLPKDKQLWPSEQRLAAHYEAFKQTQALV